MKGGLRFAIIANRITAEQREQIHGIVKEHADGWWHAFADLWIVDGKSAAEWRDQVGAAVVSQPGDVLVLKIDTASPGTWAYYASLRDAAKDWLHNEL